MSKLAVIVVDLQNEYLPTGKLPLSNIENAVANAACVIQHARTTGIPVIHIRHEQPGGAIFTPGSDGVLIQPPVAPLAGETVVVKHFPNSFRGTNLKAVLDEQGIEALVVIGAMSHMCIDATTRAAADLGYTVTVIHDACATMDLEFNGQKATAAQVHAALMAALAFAYASVVDTQSFVGA